MSSTRRHFVTALGAATTMSQLVPAPARAQSARLEPVRIGVVPVEVCSEAFYGIDLDIFRKAGVDAQLQWFSSPGAIGTALLGGAIDVGLVDTLGAISAHSRNVPLVFLASGKLYEDADPTIGTVVLSSSPFHSAKDVAGTLAVSSINNIGMLCTLAWLDRNGGDSKKVKFIEMPFPAMNEAVLQRGIDGAVTVEPWLSDAAEHGFRTVWPTNGLGSVWAASAWAATRAWSEANAAVVRRFTAAIYEAGRWGNHNRAASIPIVAKYTKLPAAGLAKMHRGMFAESTDTALVQPVIDAMATYAFIPKGFVAADIVYRA